VFPGGRLGAALAMSVLILCVQSASYPLLRMQLFQHDSQRQYNGRRGLLKKFEAPYQYSLVGKDYWKWGKTLSEGNE
jgi:hypothetical protein